MKKLFLSFSALLSMSLAIAQTSEKNSVNQTGYNNSAEISQNGDPNSVIIKQIGDDNSSKVEQGLSDNLSTEGFISQTQRGQQNTATILQLGTSNSISQEQLGNRNFLQATQSSASESGNIEQIQHGDDNKANAEIGILPGSSELLDNQIFQEQKGIFNTLTAKQEDGNENKPLWTKVHRFLNLTKVSIT